MNEKELCKYFEPGNHVKVVSGTQEGATGMVVKVEQHVLIILSDTTKEHVSDKLIIQQLNSLVECFCDVEMMLSSVGFRFVFLRMIL